jgi:hypothetical protein
MNATLCELIARIPSAEKMTVTTRASEKCESDASYRERKHPSCANKIKWQLGMKNLDECAGNQNDIKMTTGKPPSQTPKNQRRRER